MVIYGNLCNMASFTSMSHPWLALMSSSHNIHSQDTRFALRRSWWSLSFAPQPSSNCPTGKPFKVHISNCEQVFKCFTTLDCAFSHDPELSDFYITSRFKMEKKNTWHSGTIHLLQSEAAKTCWETPPAAVQSTLPALRPRPGEFQSRVIDSWSLCHYLPQKDPSDDVFDTIWYLIVSSSFLTPLRIHCSRPVFDRQAQFRIFGSVMAHLPLPSAWALLLARRSTWQILCRAIEPHMFSRCHDMKCLKIHPCNVVHVHEFMFPSSSYLRNPYQPTQIHLQKENGWLLSVSISRFCPPERASNSSSTTSNSALLVSNCCKPRDIYTSMLRINYNTFTHPKPKKLIGNISNLQYVGFSLTTFHSFLVGFSITKYTLFRAPCDPPSPWMTPKTGLRASRQPHFSIFATLLARHGK